MNEIIVPSEIITNKIYFIRKQKVMLDRDLAALFIVKPYRLREAVARNIEKFPEHFMFRLNETEVEVLTDNLSLKLEVEQIKKKLINQDKNIELVFSYLDELIDKQDSKTEREKIGYKK